MSKAWSHLRKPLVFIPMIIGGIFIALIVAFVLGLVVMALWNWLMPEIFGLPEIGYWQAWGLVLLAHILFKIGPGHRNDRHDHDHDREKWKARFRKRFCRPEPHNGPEPHTETGRDKDDQQRVGDSDTD